MRPLSVKLLRFLFRSLSKSTLVDGLLVSAVAPNLLSKVQDALATIQAYDPLRYSRMMKDVKEISVEILPGAIGCFESSERRCKIDERFVTNATRSRIALLLVHEATHARLWGRGIGYANEIRARVEQVCIRQEQVFAHRLPSAEAVVGELECKLSSRGEAFYSVEAWQRRHLRGWIAALHHLNAPRWLIFFMLKRRRADLKR